MAPNRRHDMPSRGFRRKPPTAGWRMRKWIVLAIVLAVAIAAVIAARNLDAYLNSNRVWLAARLEQALGRKVAFDEIGVSFAGGLGVRIKGVRIADDPA